jgi:HEPN domain-containing protein
MKWKEQARSLIKKAEQDEFAADKRLEDPAAPGEIIGFHLQQATEKLLKAALSFSKLEFPRTHQLVVLIDLLNDHGVSVPEDFEDLKMLAPYAVKFRYDFLDESDLMKKKLDFPAKRKLVTKLKKWVKKLDKS